MCWLINTWSESAKYPCADTCYCTFEGCFVESAHIFVKQYGIIKGQFKMSQWLFHDILFLTFDMPFFINADLKRVERSLLGELAHF